MGIKNLGFQWKVVAFKPMALWKTIFFKLIERWFYTKLWQKQNKKIENIFIAQFYTVTTHKFLCKD